MLGVPFSFVCSPGPAPCGFGCARCVLWLDWIAAVRCLVAWQPSPPVRRSGCAWLS